VSIGAHLPVIQGRLLFAPQRSLNPVALLAVASAAKSNPRAKYETNIQKHILDRRFERLNYHNAGASRLVDRRLR
jgi:hypothetical protein